MLEHVGGSAQQRFVIQELLRTCRSVFLTIPDRSFPIEVHTFPPVVLVTKTRLPTVITTAQILLLDHGSEPEPPDAVRAHAGDASIRATLSISRYLVKSSPLDP